MPAPRPIEALTHTAPREGAARLLAEYAKPDTAYPFAPRVQWQKDYNDYEHLARFKEWSEGE